MTGLPRAADKQKELHTQLVRNIVRLNGGAPELFDVTCMSDGTVRVTGPRFTTCYAYQAWVSKFTRDLQEGLFTRRLSGDSSLEKRFSG